MRLEHITRWFVNKLSDSAYRIVGRMRDLAYAELIPTDLKKERNRYLPRDLAYIRAIPRFIVASDLLVLQLLGSDLTVPRFLYISSAATYLYYNSAHILAGYPDSPPDALVDIAYTLYKHWTRCDPRG